MNTGIQTDHRGKRQAFARGLDSSPSRRTKSLYRQKGGGRGHFNQETGLEATCYLSGYLCVWKNELPREGMGVRVGEANKYCRDLEDETEAWDFIPGEAGDFDHS